MSAPQFVMIIKAREIYKTLGPKCAAGYLRNRGFSFEKALEALGIKPRFVD